MNYELYDKQGSIYLKNIDKRKYISDREEFDKTINYFLHNDYIVKYKNGNLYLTTKRRTLKISHLKETMENKYLSDLFTNVTKSINERGFINLDNLKDKKNVKKHNKLSKSTVKKTLIVLLTISLSYQASTFAYKKLAEKNSNDLINNNVTVTQYVDIQNDIPNNIEESLIDINQNNDLLALEEIKEVPAIELNYERKYDTDKAINAKNNYYDVIKKYANLYGLDSNVVLGIATQERGVHSTEIDKGGGLGLMQIQCSVWNGHYATGYVLNEESGKYEKKTILIDKEKLSNLDTNIEIGCMILQSCLINCNYNIPMAIQMYNMGYGSVINIVKTYATNNNMNYQDVINNPIDTGWLDYRYLKNGDPEYIEHVNQWLENNDYLFVNIKNLDTVNLNFESSLNISKSL